MLIDLREPVDILNDLWLKLTRAPANPEHPFRTFAFVSLAQDDSSDGRTVVLRETDRDRRRLLIHTDQRSEKCRQLNRNPRSTCLFYDPAEKLQLRLRTLTTIHTDDVIANEQWQHLPDRNRRVYATPLPSGQRLDAMNTRVLPNNSTGREHFAVLQCQVTSIDWLYLHPDGHRRIRFTWDNDHLTNEWLAP